MALGFTSIAHNGWMLGAFGRKVRRHSKRKGTKKNATDAGKSLEFSCSQHWADSHHRYAANYSKSATAAEPDSSN